MRLLLIVNTSASSVTARGRVVIQKALAADHQVRVAETGRQGHATRLAIGAARDGTDVVVALGGDGTLNEAANGIAGTRTALAVLPGGSTNVFARTLGLVNDPIEATGQLLAALARPDSIRSIGLGSLNGRYFLFNAGIGFDAAVISQVEKRGSWKRWAGHPLFVYAAFATWFRHYDRSGPSLAVEFSDTGDEVDDGYFALVLNTDPYTFLGDRPLHVAPGASLDRGLSTATFRSLSFVPFLRIVGSALGLGKPVGSHRTLDLRDDQHAFCVRGLGAPLSHQVDGEYLGEADVLRFAHEPDVLRLVMP